MQNQLVRRENSDGGTVEGRGKRYRCREEREDRRLEKGWEDGESLLRVSDDSDNGRW